MSKMKTIIGHHRWRRKIALLFFCISIVLLGFLKLGYILIISHHDDTHERPHLSSQISLQVQSPSSPPKLAFLFLARNRMPLDLVWNIFFQEAAKDLFSIYIHSRPGVVYSKKTTVCKYFYDRQLQNSILVDWGGATMIEAERLLLAEALKDPSNERFLLLSDSCAPLYNFTYIYGYIMASPKSFVDSFLDTKEKRYNPKMGPTIQIEKWRKGSQWFALKRDHAAFVAYDDNVFPLFQKHCKRRPLPEFWRQQHMVGDPSKQHNCIPDEHYVQTLLAIRGFEGEIERRTVTYTLWNQSTRDQERKGWHPVTFTYSDTSPELVDGIKRIVSVYYETEYRTEWCSSNETLRPCFLFARKFTRGAAVKLLNQTIFDASQSI